MAYNHQPPHGGAADSYYQSGQQGIGYGQPGPGQYQGGPYQQHQAAGYQQQGQGQYQYQQQPQPNQQQQGPPPQQYPQQPPNYGNNMPPQNVPNPQNGKMSTFEQTFDQTFKVDKPKYNDSWAALLFLATFLGFCAVSGLAIHGYVLGHRGGAINDARGTVSLNTHTIVLFTFVLAMAFFAAAAYFWLIRTFTKQAIWATAILQVVVGIGTAIFYFVRGYYSPGIVFLIFSVFYIFCFISWRSRIPFSVLILQTVIDVSKNYGHVFVVSAIGGLVATAFGAWFSVTLVSVYVRYYPRNEACAEQGGCSRAKVIGLLVFITFAGYWITEVIKNVIHVTISGVYGAWYFCSQKPGGVPKGATGGAFKRSMTYSFGSISFGSLIVAVIQFLRQACSVAQQGQAAQGNTLTVAIFCCMQCLLGILDWAIQFINEYAFSYIALYGKAYIPAAKTTWTMMKDRGIDALVNDCLINPVLTMGAVFVAYLCSLLACIYLIVTRPEYNEDNGFTVVIMAFAFLIGLQIANIFLVPIKSGVATLFVAMAFDPEVLINEFPDLWRQLIQVYPHVQQAVHV